VADDRCAFCLIVRGEAEASVVHDDVVLAFMDLRPVTDGHVLVVPKARVAGLEKLDEPVGVRMWQTAHRSGRSRDDDPRATPLTQAPIMSIM
jgi:diadenosine tetraphosphate (Ap4A) HIT family hydrolase